MPVTTHTLTCGHTTYRESPRERDWCARCKTYRPVKRTEENR